MSGKNVVFFMKEKLVKERAVVKKIVWTWSHDVPEPIRRAVVTLLSFPRRPCYVLEKLEELELEPGEYEVKRGNKSIYIVVSKEEVGDSILDVIVTLGDIVNPDSADDKCTVYKAETDKGVALMAYDKKGGSAVLMVKNGSPRFYILTRK